MWRQGDSVPTWDEDQGALALLHHGLERRAARRHEPEPLDKLADDRQAEQRVRDPDDAIPAPRELPQPARLLPEDHTE